MTLNPQMMILKSWSFVERAVFFHCYYSSLTIRYIFDYMNLWAHFLVSKAKVIIISFIFLIQCHYISKYQLNNFPSKGIFLYP